MSSLGIDLKAGLGSGSVSVSSVSSSGSSDDQAQLGVFSESGQMCAIKEVRVADDDQTSKECLKQLNQEMASKIVDDPEENPVEDPKEDPEEDKEENQIVSANEGEQDSYLEIEEAQEPEAVQALKKRLKELEDKWTGDKRTKMKLDKIKKLLEENARLEKKKNRLEKQQSALKRRRNELEDMWTEEKRTKMTALKRRRNELEDMLAEEKITKMRRLHDITRLHNIAKGLEKRRDRLNNRLEKEESAFRESVERLQKRIEDYPSEEGEDGLTIDRSVFLKMVAEARYEFEILAGP